MTRQRLIFTMIIVAAIITTACGMWAAGLGAGRTQYYSVKVIKSFPHDRRAYCQGLLIHNDRLLEGTGKYGESSLREVDQDSGRVLKRVDLPASVFGEGIAVEGDRILQLSWKNRTAYEYNLETLELTGRRFSYTGEGWGLTHDGKQWIMSDGTSVLRFLDTQTFKQTGEVSVSLDGQRIINLNELEFIDGEVYANIWKKDTIVRIDPNSGTVTGVIDLRSVYRSGRRHYDDVLNGIAYDPTQKKLYVTGKNWPRMFEIELVLQKSRQR
jgi:glutamine cyclotransferase